MFTWCKYESNSDKDCRGRGKLSEIPGYIFKFVKYPKYFITQIIELKEKKNLHKHNECYLISNKNKNFSTFSTIDTLMR